MLRTWLPCLLPAYCGLGTLLVLLRKAGSYGDSWLGRFSAGSSRSAIGLDPFKLPWDGNSEARTLPGLVQVSNLMQLLVHQEKKEKNLVVTPPSRLFQRFDIRPSTPIYL